MWDDSGPPESASSKPSGPFFLGGAAKGAGDLKWDPVPQHTRPQNAIEQGTSLSGGNAYLTIVKPRRSTPLQHVVGETQEEDHTDLIKISKPSMESGSLS